MDEAVVGLIGSLAGALVGGVFGWSASLHAQSEALRQQGDRENRRKRADVYMKVYEALRVLLWRCEQLEDLGEEGGFYENVLQASESEFVPLISREMSRLASAAMRASVYADSQPDRQRLDAIEAFARIERFEGVVNSTDWVLWASNQETRVKLDSLMRYVTQWIRRDLYGEPMALHMFPLDTDQARKARE